MALDCIGPVPDNSSCQPLHNGFIRTLFGNEIVHLYVKQVFSYIYLF